MYVCMYKYIFMLYICSTILKSKNQIMHHSLCFNLLMLDFDSFDNQGSEINRNNIF